MVRKKDDAPATASDPRNAKVARLAELSVDQICDALKRGTQRVEYQVDGDVLQGFLALVELNGPPGSDLTIGATERADKAAAELEDALERARKAERDYLTSQRDLDAANAKVAKLERELDAATAPATGKTTKPANG